MVRSSRQDGISGIGLPLALAVGCLVGRYLFPAVRQRGGTVLPHTLDIVLLLAVAVSVAYDLRQRRRAEETLATRNRLLEQQTVEMQAQRAELTQTADDLTHANLMMAQASRRFEALFQGLPVACFCYDTDGRVLEWNQAFEALFEIQSKDIHQHPVWDVVGGAEHQDVNRRLIRRVIAGESFEDLEWTYRRSDGTLRHIQCSTFPLRDLQGEIVGGITVDLDVTAAKQAEHALLEANAQLEMLATLDGMTGLMNHRVFQERLTQEFDRAHRYQEPLSLVMLDVDHFKRYNDLYGHQAGDEALKAVSLVLSRQVRATDMAARYGGEEFAILLPHTDTAGARVLAERFRAAIAELEWPHAPITASLGVATYQFTDPNPAQLVAEADAALYAAKEEGRNCVRHYGDLLLDGPRAHPRAAPCVHGYA